MAYESFTHDSPYEVVAFATEAPYLVAEEKAGLPVVALDELASRFGPAEVEAFVAVSFTELNRLRERLFLAVKEAGFTCASYVSARASVWHNAELGENVFVAHGATVDHRSRVGNDVTL